MEQIGIKAPIDTRATLKDFKKTVSDYLAWEVSNLLKTKEMTAWEIEVHERKIK